MKVRGQRKCRECGHRWSYYETGNVSCPACGSLRSVGVEERRLHTDTPVKLDLSSHRSAAEKGTVRDAADDLKSDLREYVHKRGFVSGGDLRPLDETYLAARELLHAVDVYARLRDPDEDEQLYVLSLLRDADAGESRRPAADEVPDSMVEARGLAAAESVDAFRSDAGSWLDDRTIDDPDARDALESLRAQVKRVEALQGDVPVSESDALVAAARDLGAYLTTDDLNALATARDRLDRLGGV